MNHTFVYLLESPRPGDSEENMGISMKNTRSADCCADQIDVIKNLAVITKSL